LSQLGQAPPPEPQAEEQMPEPIPSQVSPPDSLLPTTEGPVEIAPESIAQPEEEARIETVLETIPPAEKQRKRKRRAAAPAPRQKKPATKTTRLRKKPAGE
jgi:hypothetical protein